jgi:SAM-dependent methyltransferase
MGARSHETTTATAAPSRGINYERLYHYRFRDVDQAGKQAVWNEIARYIYERLGTPGSVLDPAAGRGEFITAVPADERWGVDLVRQGDLEAAGVKMIIGDIMDVELPREHFDGVFMSNFLEHLPDQDSVGTVLGKLRDAMQPGGRIAIMGPNFRYCAKNYFDCADHMVILSHIGMEEHVYAAGFEVESVAPRFLPFSFRSLLPPSPALTRTYLRTPAMWRLLGKQFLVIGRKPSASGAPAIDR